MNSNFQVIVLFLNQRTYKKLPSWDILKFLQTSEEICGWSEKKIFRFRNYD